MGVDTAVIFGLLAGFAWGTGPIASKFAFHDGASPIVAACTQTTVAVIGLWSLTVASAGVDVVFQSSPVMVLPFVATGIVASSMGRYLLYLGIERVGASINSSVAATDPLFAVGIAAVFLQEIPTLIQLIGGVGAVTGIVIVASSSGGNKSGWKLRALFIPLTGAIFYGIAAVIRRYGFLETAISPIYASAINETTALVVLGSVLLVNRANTTESERVKLESYKYLILTGILYAGGTISLFVSLNTGPVIIGSTLGATAAVVSVIGSRLILSDEIVTKRLAIGTILTVFGVVAVSL